MKVMKTTLTLCLILGMAGKSFSQSAETPLQFERGYPTTDTAEKAHYATDQNRAALRSHVDKLQLNADGSYTFYFGPNAPEGKEDMWIETITGKGWWSVLRIYGRKRLASTAPGNPATSSR